MGTNIPPEVARVCLILYPKPMRFVSEGVCVMHYCGRYVLSEVCVKRGSTVLTLSNFVV